MKKIGLLGYTATHSSNFDENLNVCSIRRRKGTQYITLYRDTQ